METAPLRSYLIPGQSSSAALGVVASQMMEEVRRRARDRSSSKVAMNGDSPIGDSYRKSRAFIRLRLPGNGLSWR